jgi:hypothetical protein
MEKIVVLHAAAVGDGTWTATCVFWLTAPSNNRVPKPNFFSQATTVPADVQAALEAGDLVEQMQVSPLFPAEYDLADARAALEELYAREQAELDATNPPVAGLVGSRFDGAAWT